MGVMFGDAPQEYADPVTEYGERIGVAFQLVDDVIDLSPKKEQTGKRAGTDLRAGVATLPLLLLRGRAAAGDAAAAELLQRIDVLVDGKFDLEQRDLTLPFRGSRNQRVIDMEKTRQTGCIVKKKLD